MLRYFANGRLRWKNPMVCNTRTNWEFYAVIDGKCGPVFRDDQPPVLCEKTLWIFSPECSHAWADDGRRKYHRIVLHFGSVPYPLGEIVRAQGWFAKKLTDADIARLQAIAAELEPHFCEPNFISPVVFQGRLMDLTALALASFATAAEPLRVMSFNVRLSAAKDGRNGRHPLPTAEEFASRMARLGCHDGLQVVAYDTAGGMYAARLWWMLRWIGHASVQVLDGGLAAWDGAGGALVGGPVPQRPAGQFSVRPALARSLSFSEVLAGLGQGQRLVVDARAPDRFRGENETLDPVGGHIPGAGNRFFRENLAPDGQFKPADQLRAEWLALMGTRGAADLVAQCGSGVTACHNLLALESAGLTGASLYAGSWSEWCAHPARPVTR